jgi:hypothetical protein
MSDTKAKARRSTAKKETAGSKITIAYKAAEATEAPKSPPTDALDIPDSLKVENRVPLTPEQEAKVAEVKAKAQATQKPKPPVKIAKTTKGPSLSHKLKEIVVREPRINADELYARLAKAGYTGRSIVTIKTLLSDAVTTLKVAKEAGLYTGDL